MPTNPRATCKFQVVTLGREEAIAKSCLDGQKSDTEAYQADELAKGSKIPKATVTLMRKSDEKTRKDV